MVKKLIVFDLDETLAASKSSLDAEMSSLLHDLLGVVKVSYCPQVLKGREPDRLDQFTSHHRLATPVSPWERLKVGAGTPPILTKHGWMIVYHGVSEAAGTGSDGHRLCYSTGVMVRSKQHPRVARYRSV